MKKQISFVGFTKRPKEALGKAYKTFVFQKNLEWKAGVASEKSFQSQFSVSGYSVQIEKLKA
ncbi:MAG: hypothetical protein CVU07_11835, partial [Bacteroidetes bacterium HGW-Bacteroidetes-23]